MEIFFPIIKNNNSMALYITVLEVLFIEILFIRATFMWSYENNANSITHQIHQVTPDKQITNLSSKLHCMEGQQEITVL